jgi:hypothetical protein
MNAYLGSGTTFCEYSKNEINTHVSQYPSCLATSSANCDVNGDSLTNASDLQALANVILRTNACPGSCDSNKDGSINALDVQLEANVILGTATCP